MRITVGGNSSQKKEHDKSPVSRACIRRPTSEAGGKINEGNSVICAQVFKGDWGTTQSLMSLMEECIAYGSTGKTSCHSTRSHCGSTRFGLEAESWAREKHRPQCLLGFPSERQSRVNSLVLARFIDSGGLWNTGTVHSRRLSDPGLT